MIVPSENVKNHPEMQKTCQKCNCTVRKCKKPHGNAIVPSGSRKNRTEMRSYHPEMQHDGVNFISAPFFLFPGGNIHFRLDDLVFVLGKMVGEKKDLQGF